MFKALVATVVLAAAAPATSAVIYQESGTISQYGQDKQISVPALAPGGYEIYFSVDQSSDLAGQVHARLLPMDCYFGLGCSANPVDRYYSVNTTGLGYSLAFSLSAPQAPCTPTAVDNYCSYVAGDIVADITVNAYQPFSDVELNYTFVLASVPEPASWALMIAGFGFVGAAARRRSPQAQHA